MAEETKESTLRSLNDEAISLLQSGNYGAASCVLQEALTRMKASLQGQGNRWKDTVSASPDPRGGGNGEESTGRVCIPIGVVVAGQDRSTMMRGGDNEEDVLSASVAGPVFRFFDRAFALPQQQACDDNRISCAILYNLALSHTLAWRESGDSADMELAFKLHQMALSIVEGCLVNSHVPSNDDFVILMLLSIFNNLGYLQCQQQQQQQGHQPSERRHQGLSLPIPLTEATQHCVHAIQALLSSRNADTNNNNTAHAEEYNFFRRSSLFLFDRKDLSMAPAA